MFGCRVSCAISTILSASSHGAHAWVRSVFVVKSRDGTEVKIVLADNAVAVGIVILAAKKLPDGTLQAARVNYGKDGLTPPM